MKQLLSIILLLSIVSLNVKGQICLNGEREDIKKEINNIYGCKKITINETIISTYQYWKGNDTKTVYNDTIVILKVKIHEVPEATIEYYFDEVNNINLCDSIVFKFYHINNNKEKIAINLMKNNLSQWRKIDTTIYISKNKMLGNTKDKDGVKRFGCPILKILKKQKDENIETIIVYFELFDKETWKKLKKTWTKL
ncbi:MAG: hypothetical protein ACOYO1_13325 [Bacteroidales bacterium]